MFNPEPLQFRWQKLAIGPAILFVLALVAAGAFWLQKAGPAGADEETYYRYYEGTANVKVKNGNAYSVFPVYTCTVVETDGPNGDIIDVFIFGVNVNEDFGDSDVGEILCNEFSCFCQDPGSTLEGSDVEEMLPGTFLIQTYVDELLTGGTGWKTNPQKQTSTQWKFTLKKPELAAGLVVLNDDARPLQANSTLLTKFIRGRAGVYWKVAGLAPLNDNGTPKVTVEIETPALGHDAPPEFISGTPDFYGDADSDTSMTAVFSEPVNVDPDGVEVYCYDAGEYFDFTISGQGTSTIVVDPVTDLPYGDFCELYIYPEAITDVDTVDPPNEAIDEVWMPFYIWGQ